MGIDFSKVNSGPINNIAIQLTLIIAVVVISMVVVGIVLKSLNAPRFIIDKILGLVAVIIVFGMLYILY